MRAPILPANELHSTEEDHVPRRDSARGAPSPFTGYVRSLAPSGEPDSESFERLWATLRRVLRSELKNRGLWESSPVLLGVHGWRHWWAEAQERGSGDALDELASDVYVYVFVDRLRSLRAHLRHKPNIDGLVFRCLRNYLYDVQKRQDPLGFRIFSLIKSALRQLVQEGSLYVVAGSRRIANDTVFAFQRDAAPAQAELNDLVAVVRAWNDELLADLVVGRGTGEDAVVARLERRLLALADDGVEVFRTYDVVAPLKADVRARWAGLFEQEGGERAFEDLEDDLAEVVRIVRPDGAFEERESFDRLVACVNERLERFRARRRTLDYLRALWHFLRTFAAEAQVDGAELRRQLSRRKLGRQLSIPRDRLPELFETLRQMVRECFQASRADRQLIMVGGHMIDERRQDLTRRTVQAWRRAAASATTPDRQGDGPGPGQLYLLPKIVSEDIEWLVVVAGDGAAPSEGFFVVAADLDPLAGSTDITVPTAEAAGPLTLRCDVGTWVEAHCIEASQRTGRVSDDVLQRVLEKRRKIAAGQVVGTVAEREVDRDPEYAEWREILAEARDSLAAAQNIQPPTEEPVARPVGVTRPSASPRRRPHRIGSRRPAVGPRRALALAAMIFLAAFAIGLFTATRESSDSPGGTSLVNLPIFGLVNQPNRTTATPFRLAADAPGFVLVLSLPAGEPLEASYRLEIRDAGSQEVLARHSGLQAPGAGELTLVVRRGELPAGDYELPLYRQESAGEHLVANFRFRLFVE